MAPARVVVVCGDRAGRVMAGPAIRAVELAQGLAGAGHPVVLAAPVGSDPNIDDLAVTTWSSRGDLRAAVAAAQVVVVFAAVLADHLWLADLDVPLVVDSYDPALFETLEGRRGEPLNAQRDWVADASRHQLHPLAVADVVLVASERQRHFALGSLAALGRLGPRTVAEDPTLEQLVRIVPFGLPDEPPEHGSSPLRGPDGPFGADDVVALWGGGLYPWLDPLTLVDAVSEVDDDRVVAAFLAGPHPTPAVGRMPLVDEARQLALDLGLGRRVHFVERWVPYAERGRWLTGADIGVSLHHSHVETELSFRTRVLDYLWAGLPIVCTGGDVVAEAVAADDLGVVVPPGDSTVVAAALAALAGASPQKRAARRRRLADAARSHRWSETLAPLVAACAEPRLAPDRRVAENVPPRRGDGLRRAVRVAQGLPGSLVPSNGLRTEGTQ
ncbi:MAG TPA: glycosyltransferase [Acidimicrobiales bacterium]